ncbi:MAG: DNA-3-methyladenine glycosylase [bacterium]
MTVARRRSPYQPLPRRFFARDTVRVARALLGQFLVHDTPAGRLVGRIVETEAYRGDRDPASHAYRRTARSEVMYGLPGIAYVYLSYGVHYCMNVVTEGRNRPGAVLLRALELVEGSPSGGHTRDARLSSGPGRLTATMRVGPRHNGADLTRPPLYLARGEVSPDAIATGRRIGISTAQARRWRFGIAGHPSLSRPFRPPL